MAEPGLEAPQFRNILLQRAQDIEWALCIGAGTSLGALPDWQTLAKKLVAREGSFRKKGRAFSRLRKSVSAEALLQATKNRLNKTSEEFAEELSRVLYLGFKRKVRTANWGLCAHALSAISPGQMNDPLKWANYLRIITKTFHGTSAVGIARVVYEALKADRKSGARDRSRKPSVAPAAIISFNAEPLFYSLINALAATDSGWRIPMKKRRLLDRVNLGISYRAPDRTPYIFCHGILPIPDALPQFERSLSAEKLVFSEGEYISLANNSFSWSASIFLGVAVLRTMVFIGLSFTDQNLRRWQAWVQSNKIDEIRQREKLKGFTTTSRISYGHYWINKRPKTKEESSWIESSVEHLGVRLVWVDDWTQVADCLRNGMGL